MKLSKEQQRVLKLMEPGEWYSAHTLQCRITTLQALQSRGKVHSWGWREPGRFGMERTRVEWKII